MGKLASLALRSSKIGRFLPVATAFRKELEIHNKRLEGPTRATLIIFLPATYRPSGPCAISRGLQHSCVEMVLATLWSVSNIFTR